MRRAFVLGLVFALIGLVASPAAAKGPRRVTVAGPGITGEVDLIGIRWMYFEGPYFVGDLLGEELRAPRGEGPSYVLTWYAALGGGQGAAPEPLVDRVAYYPRSGTVHVLAWSGVFGADRGGWYRVAPEAEVELARVLPVAAARPGPAGYRFVVDATGWPDWAPIHGERFMGLLRRLVSGVAHGERAISSPPG